MCAIGVLSTNLVPRSVERTPAGWLLYCTRPYCFAAAVLLRRTAWILWAGRPAVHSIRFGVPLCLALMHTSDGERLIYGDSKGRVVQCLRSLESCQPGSSDVVRANRTIGRHYTFVCCPLRMHKAQEFCHADGVHVGTKLMVLCHNHANLVG